MKIIVNETEIDVIQGPSEWSQKELKPFRNKCGVYLIWNKITNNGYIGYSSSIVNRWRGHRKSLNEGTHHNIVLQRAWDKHKEKSFQFHIINLYDVSNLSKMEVEWIAKTESYGKGYNLTPGGEEWSPEMRKRSSDWMKSLYNKPEFMEAHRKRVSDRIKKLWEDPEYVKMKTEELKQYLKNRIFTDSQRKKLSKKATTQWEDPDFRKLITDRRKELWNDPEWSTREIQRLRDYVHNAEYVHNHRKAVENPEHIALQSRLSKERWEDNNYRTNMKSAKDEKRRVTINSMSDQIKLIRELKSQGLAFATIAKTLNKMNVPCLFKSKMRYGTTIKKLFIEVIAKQIEMENPNWSLSEELSNQKVNWHVYTSEEVRQRNLSKRKSIPEQIKVIKKLVISGYDFTNIAKELNKLGMSTITGVGKWHYRSAKSVYNEFVLNASPSISDNLIG